MGKQWASPGVTEIHRRNMVAINLLDMDKPLFWTLKSRMRLYNELLLDIVQMWLQ